MRKRTIRRFLAGFTAVAAFQAGAVAQSHAVGVKERPIFDKYATVFDKLPAGKTKGLPAPKRLARANSVRWLSRSWRILYWRTHPDAYREHRIAKLHPRDAARVIWSEEYGWSEAEIAAGYYIIRNENGRWNPCGVFARGGATCPEARALVAAWGGDRACGIPQFKPCRLELLRPDGAADQIRAFVRYVTQGGGPGHYSVLDAAAFKRAKGWY